MKTKIPSEIVQLTLADASYKGCNVTITPTLINFFFGNNGTGKSTIGRTIKVDSGVVWRDGRSVSDYAVHVYNQEYIANNLQEYQNLRGVFTVNEVNIEIQRQVEELLEKKEKAVSAMRSAGEEKKKKTAALESAWDLFMGNCWAKTADIRQLFERTQEKRKTKKTFAEAVLAITTPQEHDLDALTRLYNAAYSSSAMRYDEFATIADTAVLDNLSGRGLLAKKVVSTADTPFAQFIKALNATSWVQQGHEQYHANGNGKCPYCQQALPESFEDDIRSCFDEQYQLSIAEIVSFQTRYRDAANTLFVPLQKIPTVLLPGTDVTAYNDKIAAIKGVIATNLQKIGQKVADPSLEIEIEDVGTLLAELSVIIEGLNTPIRENNAIIAAQPKKQAECKTQVWEHIAFMLADVINSYNTSKRQLEKDISTLTGVISEKRTEIGDLTRDISEKNKNSVNTKATIDSVNLLLRDSGFQGFFIREKENTPNVYEVVRPDGSIAENLSEGERNFIAFLYFYHQVKGSESADGIQRDKVVVIDDPVSSMDSSSLFIVSALVREMIEVCENNAVGGSPVASGRYIKQIFILTHNAYFHREITYNRVKCFEYVNFYLISKVDNKSSIRCCTRPNPKVMTECENFNPVQNSYAALWEEYKTVNSPIPLMNVIRRILEYYFLQLCGYEGATLRNVILTEHKNEFITVDENGKEDYTRYQMAHAMLSYISANSVGINDGINFVDDCVDVEQTKETFRLIFVWMKQQQHYDMMMGND